ncbi:DIP1984 family protein, partial [Micromonospora sp. DH13]|uniref:DIP1984 family protein n=1 Tax=Micromonospora sp. DH13 TaxID=2857013 RepID=UPI001E3B6312
FEGDATLTDAIARRDALLRAGRLYSAVADAATSRMNRYSRSEVRYVPTVDAAALRKMSDGAAKEYRQLDTKIQQLNWASELR